MRPGVTVGVGVGASVAVGVAVAVGVGVDVAVGRGVNVAVGVEVKRGVAVGVNGAVAVAVGVRVALAVAVGVNVAVATGVGVDDGVGVGLGAREGLGLAAGIRRCPDIATQRFWFAPTHPGLLMATSPLAWVPSTTARFSKLYVACPGADDITLAKQAIRKPKITGNVFTSFPLSLVEVCVPVVA